MLAYQPFCVEDFGAGRGTASGSLYRYDTDVPLIFYGAGFRPGRQSEDVEAIDIAPTLAALLGMPVPAAATGSVLSQVLAPKETVVGPAPKTRP
jgi:arylsulfatase A-like enzyme